MKKNQFIGLSIALVDDQNVVWSEGFGYADKSNNEFASSDTLYRAGSVTKIFTATAVMRLVEENQVDLDAPLSTYIPNFNLKSRFGSIDEITLRNTLSHHSGIPSNILDGMWSKNPVSFKSVTSKINDYYAAYAPNTLFSYSNAGYSLVGHAIENASGTAYTDYMHSSVLKPLGMQSSAYSMSVQNDKLSKSYWNGKEVDELKLRDLPAGGLITNVNDLAQFIKMVNADGASIESVLKPETLRTMLSVQRFETPYEPDSRNTIGWINLPDFLNDQYDVVGHSGQTLAHSATLIVVPEIKLGVVILANSPSLEGQLDAMAKNILKIAYPVKTRQALNTRNGAVSSSIKSDVTTFEGTFSSEAGLTEITKKSGGYNIEAAGEKLALSKNKSGEHKLKYKLFGYIPIAIGPLAQMNFEARNNNGQKLIFVEAFGTKQLVASEINEDARNKVWDARIGEYELLNPIDTDIAIAKIDGASLGYSNNVYYFNLKSPLKSRKIPVKIINDSELILQGYSRGLGETIFAKQDDTLVHSGLIFKRK